MFRFTVDHASDQVVWLNRNGGFEYVNEQACRMLGYARAELMQLSLWDIAPTFPREQWERNWQYLHNGNQGESLAFESSQRRKSGESFPVDVRVKQLRFGEREIHVVDVRDITERKRVEAALQESEELYRAVFRNTGTATVLIEEDTTISLANAQFEALSKFSKKEIEGKKSWTEFVFRDDLDRMRTQHRLRREHQEEALNEYEFRFVARDGAMRNILLTIDVIPETKKSIASLLDITERKQADAALKESITRLQTVVTGAPIVLYSFDKHGIYTLSEGKGLARIGLKPGELVGQSCLDVYPGHPDYNDSLHRALAGETFSTPVRSGELVFEAFHTPLRDEDGAYAGTIGVLVDVSDRERAETEIRRLNRELEERVAERTAQFEAANKELEAFAYSVSHDLRAPLRAIDGYARILVEDYEASLDSEGKRVCAVINDEVRRMGTLIDDLLTFSRLGRSHMVQVVIDETALVSAVFHELAAPDVRSRIDFRLPQIPPSPGDPRLMRQVWTNLLSNAIKFSSKRERPAIEVHGEVSGDEIVYSVADNGAGFDMQYAGKLFGVFQRLHSTSEFEGTGVGLAIVQRIIHRHGGRVWAEGRPDQGATFFFSVPSKGVSP
jgi:PAS domain S-box-containing protein